MAISLTAEQRSLSRLFIQREQYIIPDYQRPYSWGQEQCSKLYDDINEAFNADIDYFIGNIILAVGEKSKDKPRVVDGQQRLISIWLIFKVLSVLKPAKSCSSPSLNLPTTTPSITQPLSTSRAKSAPEGSIYRWLGSR